MKLFCVLAVAAALATSSFSQVQPGNAPVDSVQLALNEAVAKARAALNTYGETDSAMTAIETALSEIAALPGLKTRAPLKSLHGGKNMGRALLASEGDSGICLYLSWFGKGAATPVHDHLTWGVLRVLEGKDKHCRWRRRVPSEADSALVGKFEEKVLGAGQSIYWLGPPNDIHTQQTVGDTDTWELVMVGRDLSSDYVTHNQSRYDPATGRPVPKEQKK